MCCAPVRDVDSIVIPQALNHFPGQAPDVAGVFQYRSHTVSVHKLHTKFGLPELEDRTKGRIIMAYTHHGLTGFWADEIEEITSEYEAHWSAPPGFVDGNIFDKTLLWREKMLLHTDFDRLFAMRDAAPLTNWIVEHGDELNPDNTPNTQENHDEYTVSDDTTNVVNLPVDLSKEDALPVADSATEDPVSEIDSSQEILAGEDESSAADEIGEEDMGADIVDDKVSMDASEAGDFTLDQVGEVDDSLYYLALDALQPDSDVDSSEIQELDTELPENQQAYTEQLESGEISSLSISDVDETQNDDLVENIVDSFVEKTDVVMEIKSDPIEMKSVVDDLYQVEPIEPIVSDRESKIVMSRKGGDAGLYSGKYSSYKIVGGVSALILVAAIGGYITSGGDEAVEATAVSGVAEAKMSSPAITPIAEIIAPDEMTDLTMGAADVESDVTEQSSLSGSLSPGASLSLQTLEEVVEAEFNKSVQSNNGVTGFTTKKRKDANIIDDKAQGMVPIHTTIAESPLKPLEPQLPMWGLHVVSKGDTLWHLAARYLNNPFRYIELANWNDINNPDRIYPGENVKYKEEK